MITQIPGFADAIHDSQHTFRSLLEALARPGTQQTTAPLVPPEGLCISAAAALLTLLDLETSLWLQPGSPAAIAGWVTFHTGCQITNQCDRADFALIHTPAKIPDLTAFSWGTPEYPEASTSLLIQCPDLTSDVVQWLQGPGIPTAIAATIPLSAQFWQQWQVMTTHFPLGVDAWFFSQQQVIGLSRTTQVQLSSR
jgi:alpha-D-ribose 1-methylphosphonate 5-triphosphate synthase subunit PhnH